MAYSGIKRTLLETKSFSSGGSVQITLKEVPPFRRIKFLLFRFHVTVTNAATGAAKTAAMLRRIVYKTIRIGKLTYTTGSHLRVLDWHVRGLETQVLAGTAADNAGVYDRIVEAKIPWEDTYNASNPSDTGQMSQMFRETPIQVDFDTESSIFGASNTPTVAGTLRVYAYHEPLAPGRVPGVVEVGYTDWTGQRVTIEGDRAYTHLHCFNEDGSVITSAEITGFTLAADGEQYDNVSLLPQDVAAGFNALAADGRAEASASATAPVGGESLTDHPGVAAAAGAVVSMEFVPLFGVGAGYGIMDALHATKSLSLDFTGTKTSFRIGWRAIVPKSADDRAALAMLAGASNPRGPFAVRTRDGRPTRDPRAVALLPLQFPVG
jgi:hypothetical protein